MPNSKTKTYMALLEAVNEVNNRSKDPLEHAWDMLVTSYEGPKNEEAINKYLAMNVTGVAEKCGCDPEELYDAVRVYLLRGVTTEGKPDFLDLDKDGDTEEPMKKAAAEAEKAKGPNEMFGLGKIAKAAEHLKAVHRNSDKFNAALEKLSNELTTKELGEVGTKLYDKKFDSPKETNKNDKRGMVKAIGRARRRKEDIEAA
jgi:hypothetical protein